MIEILVSISVSFLSVLAVSSVILSMGKFQARANFLIVLSQIRLNFQQHIVRQNDWNADLHNNLSMACFSGSATDLPGSPASCLSLNGVSTPFALYENVGSVIKIYDSVPPNTGFTTAGSACSTFSSTAPDPAGCVLKPQLTFTVQCNASVDSSCLSPLVVVKLTYIYNGPDMGSIDFAGYGFQVTNTSFPLKVNPPCTGPLPGASGGPPACISPNQQIICLSTGWYCGEFGL